MRDLYDEACFDYTMSPTWWRFAKAMLFLFLWCVGWPFALILGERQ